MNTGVLDSPKPVLSEEILRLRLRMTESEGTELRVTRTIKILILGQPVENLPDDWVCPDCGSEKEFYERI